MERVFKYLEKLFFDINAWILFFRKEKKYGRKKIALKKYYWLFKGFYSDHPISYDFNKNKIADYISDIENIKLAYLNHPYGRLLRDKLVFSCFFNSYFKTPESFCLINRGMFIPVNSKISISSIDSFLELLTIKKLILKPLLGTNGFGIIKAEKNEPDYILLNRKIFTKNELKVFFETLNNYLVSEYIEQGKFSNSFFPDTANTIRLTTYFDPRKDNAFIPYCFMRFGRTNTFPVDNVSSGGLYSMIDLSTGKLNDSIEAVGDGNLRLHKNHPDKNVLIKDVVIPKWDNISKFFIKTAKLISPFIKVVGWDIIITDDSFVVIEGNNGPNLTVQGRDYPMAKNIETREFLEYFGIRSKA